MKMDDRCLFCKIVNSQDENTELVYEDEEFVAFRDIKPATKNHYLIVPRRHFPNVKYMNSQAHLDTVEKLIETGSKVLEERNCSSVDVVKGFHWPPFNAIAHLHLHVVAEASSMTFLSRIIFRPGTWWFVSPEDAVEYIRNRAKNQL